MQAIDFDAAFCRLTGNSSFPWQRKLYERFVDDRPDNIPSACDIPTGLGKTSVVAVWLIALANYRERLPRRLVYVVNRRTVVDQTTDEVMKLRTNLRAAGLVNSLCQVCAMPLQPEEAPLAVSTLRGEFADNREWSADPARPAVIAGTVDMIGSRLLFGGYGVGFKGKPLHAGFLGQDVLLVHDEAHLEPAFQTLLLEIRKEQDRCKEFRKFHVMELSATSRGGGNVLELNDNDRADPVVQKRIGARKAIRLVESADDKKQADEIAALALKFKDSKRAVLVFVRTVENVEKIVGKLKKEKQSVQQLTGTLRGLERDQLVETSIFRRFLPKADVGQETVYLVCTSAGEVGVNISADHLVCDLTTFESIAQRFGRVNRFGDRSDTEIHVVHPQAFDEENDYEARLKKTLELLRQLQGDGSPGALGRLDPVARIAAFGPTPTIVPVTDILFDSWALTTIREKLPGRPPVEPYLHGISEREPPETHVAWRQEVSALTGELLQLHAPEDLIEDYPLKPHELLRDRSDRVFKHLAMIGERHPDRPVWLLDDDGTVEILSLDQLTQKDNKYRISYRTVLLSPDVGGLRDGLLNGDSTTANDVADRWFADADKLIPRRARVRSDDPRPAWITGMRLIREIDTKPAHEEEDESAARLGIAQPTDVDGQTETGRYWRWYVRPRSADDDGSKTAQDPVTWDDHTNQVEAGAERLAAALHLSEELQAAVRLAAKFHDLGKKRMLWQRSIGNPNPLNWLAKSGKGMKPLEITDFRHEFASLLDVQMEPEFRNLSGAMKDLVLHLIAAHHGRGRPHFPLAEAFDPEPHGQNVAAIAAEIPRRFARLQRRYGRWGLAYLESLLRAADYAASANPCQSEGHR